MLIVSPLHFSSLCARREGDWGEGITMRVRFTSLFSRVSHFALPLPPTLPAVLLATAAPDSSDSYHVDGAVY